ncbi:MAG: TadE family type IV pilus minor pilin [Pseudonocardia sp.]
MPDLRLVHGDRGAVTVEAALALCSLVAVMLLVLSSVAAGAAHLRCLDAAREAARLVARGEPDRARQVAESIAPRGAVVDIRLRADEVEVRVSAAAVPGLPLLSLSADAVGVLEPAAVTSVTVPAVRDAAGRYPAESGADPSDAIDSLRAGGPP